MGVFKRNFLIYQSKTQIERRIFCGKIPIFRIVNLRNRETDLLAPRMKTSNGQKAFSFRGAKVWNELKHEVKLAPSQSTLNVD